MTEKYYLITSKFNSLNAATVLRFEGKKITDLQKNNDIKFNESIPDDWINISKNEAFHLVKIDINARIDYYEGNIFNSIKNLNQEEKCYYIKDRKRSLCTVVHKTEKTDGLYFMIKLEDGKNLMVPSYDIELLYNKRLPREVSMSKTNAELESVSNGNDVSGNGCKNDTGSNSQGESSNINSMNTESHSSSHSDNQSCSVEGRDNHFDNKGNYADASHKHEDAGNDSSVAMNVNTPNNDSENIPSLDVSTRQQGIDNGGGSKSTNSRVLDNRKVTEINQHLSPINTQFKRPYNVVTGQCRKDSYITKGQKSNEVHGGATRSDNRNIEDSQSHFAKQHGNTKLIWCDQIKLNIHNPDYIEKIVPHQKIHKYIVYRYKGTTFSVAAEWIGLVDESLSVGCVLYFDYEMATDGLFKGKYYFDCPAHRGVLVCPEGFCISDKIHKDLKFTDELSITEDSVCCITYPKPKSKIPMKREIIFKIGNSKKLVKCMWSGQINGKDTVGLDIEALQGSGTCGTFCTVKLFQSVNKCGFLYEYGNITYVPRTEYVREIYLMKDYDLTSIDKERNIDIIGKLIIVKDDPIIYGRARFCMTFLGEYLIGIELDEFNLQNNVSLLEALYYDKIIRGKYVVIVKIDYIVTANESLLYNPANGVVDVSSVKVTEGYISDHFKVEATVIYGNGEIGEIIEFHLLNDVPCVNVRQLKNNLAMYIREDAVRKFEPNNMFRKTVAPLSNNLCSDSSKRSNTDLLENNDLHNSMEQSQFKIIGLENSTSSIRSIDKQTGIGKRSLVKKVITHYTVNSVSLVNPENVTHVVSSENIDKTIMFKSNGQMTTARLRWVGQVNNEICMGCEMRDKVEHGTNGMFRYNRLFECADGRGVLILLKNVKDCCVNGSHRKPRSYPDGRINGSSICCVERLQNNSELKLEDKVMKKDANGRLFGICRWIGLINGIDVIGMEMVQCKKIEPDQCIQILDLFHSPPNKTGLFFSREIIPDPIGLCSCAKNNIPCVDISNIKSVEDAELTKKLVIYEDNKKTMVLDIRWKGLVNGVKCIACQMKAECRCGMNGRFFGERWFDCKEAKGFLVSETYFNKSCEYTGNRKEPIKYDYGGINPDSICCVESRYKINTWPNMRIGCKLKYRQNFSGTKKIGDCMWMGLVNGTEVIGTNIKEEIEFGIKRGFSLSKLFKFDGGQEVIFMADDVEHDAPYEEMVIPISERKFPNINIDSPILYYIFMNNRVVSVYGTVKWSGKDGNGEYLYGIELDKIIKDGTDGQFQQQRLFRCQDGHGIIATIDVVAPDVRFVESSKFKGPLLFESRVFHPESIIIVTCIESDEWIRDTNVEFCLNESKQKYSGSLKWTGLADDIMSAAIQVDSITDNDPLRCLLCSKEDTDRLNIPVSDNLVIVVLASVNKSEINEESTLRRIFEYVKDTDICVDILMKMVTKENPRVLMSFIKEWKYPIHLEHYPELLPSLIRQDCYNILAILLDSFVASDNDNINLLYVAKYYLVQGDYQAFLRASKKCRNTNIVLDNGEIFLTDIMKDGKDGELVNRIIGSKIFDINMVNREGESTLVVACRQLMVTTVRLLLSSGASLSYNNNMALTTTVSLKNDITEMDKLKIAFEIIELLTAGIRLEHNMCKICMDRIVNTSFSCGHTICDICSKEIIKCPDCGTKITERKRIFLP